MRQARRARAQPLFGRAAAARLREVLDRGGARLLVALDLDGTLAPIVPRPEGARIPPSRIRLLERAAAARHLRVSIVSARRLSDVRRLAPARGVLRAGQYGLEGSATDVPGAVRERARRAVARLLPALRPLVARVPGAWLEAKSTAIAVHDRAAKPAARRALLAALARLEPRARREGLRATRGRRVTEYLPRGVDKGRALRAIRRRVGADVVFYFGDSPGDEPAFAALGPGDFSVRVGGGPTCAAYRVRGPGDVARFLRTVIARRGRPVRKRR